MSESFTDRLAAVTASLEPDAFTPRIRALLRQLHQDPMLMFLDEFNVDPEDLFEQFRQAAIEEFILDLVGPLLNILKEPFNTEDTYVLALKVLRDLYVVAERYNAGSCIIEILDPDLRELIEKSD